MYLLRALRQIKKERCAVFITAMMKTGSAPYAGKQDVQVGPALPSPLATADGGV
jgi:hypothetical protein